MVPVRKNGRTLAVLAAEKPESDNDPSDNETHQRRLGARLLTMLQHGAFPIEGAPIPPRRGAPRVGDGVVELDEAHALHFAAQVPPTHALLLNVARDQLDRFAEAGGTPPGLKPWTGDSPPRPGR